MVNDQLERFGSVSVGMQNFGSHWMPHFNKFLDLLRAIDKSMAATIALGFYPDSRSVFDNHGVQEENHETGPAPLGSRDEEQAEDGAGSA
jgi:hypothetical protein